MKKSRLNIYKFLVVLLVPVLLVACASGDKDDTSPAEMNIEETGQASVDHDYEDGIGYDEIQEDYPGDSEETANVIDGENADTSKDITDGKDYMLNDTHDKIIRRVELNLETKTFDELVKSIETQVYELGGYVEQSRITGRHYNSDNLRYGVMVIRIPRETVNGFLNNIGSIANIVEKAENVDNVSLQYVDIESQKKSLEIEQERLLGLLERTEKMEDIMSLEARLTTVRYELQNLATEIRTIDNLVDYSTITMDIQEVELMNVDIETEETVGTRVKRGFEEKLHGFTKGFEDFAVWFILNLPLLIVMTIIIVIVIVIVKKIIKKIFGNDILNSKGNNRVSEDDDSNKSDDNLPDSEEVNDSNDNGDEFVEVHEEYENHEDEQK